MFLHIQVFLIYIYEIALCIIFLSYIFLRAIHVALITSSSLFLTTSQHSIICIITFYLSIISEMDEPGAFKCSFSQTVLRQTSLESIHFWGCARLSLGILPGLGVLSHILYAYLFVYLICLSKEPALGFVDLFIYLFFCLSLFY